MANKDLSTIQSIQAALDILPAEKREYIVGYAEGVLAVAEKRRADLAQADKQDSA